MTCIQTDKIVSLLRIFERMLQMNSKEHHQNNKNSFENMLTGGHPNSLGRTLEVVEIVLNNKARISELFECYSSDDEIVRLRVSSAFKRIFRQNRNWFIDYIDKFQQLIPTLKQPSAEWTLAQLHLELEDLLTEEQAESAIEITKQQLNESKDWIVIIQSMNFLQHMAMKDESLKKWLKDKLLVIAKDKRKSVSKRANVILQSFN